MAPPSSSALTAAVVVVAAVCVVLVSSLDVTAAQEVGCSECGPYCEATCGGVPEGRCNGSSCYAFPELCPECGSASSDDCATDCFLLCKSPRCRAG